MVGCSAENVRMVGKGFGMEKNWLGNITLKGSSPAFSEWLLVSASMHLSPRAVPPGSSERGGLPSFLPDAALPPFPLLFPFGSSGTGLVDKQAETTCY